MKTLLTAYLPALALLALGGCAGTTALTTSENDGVYYSSNDHTTAVATAPVQRYTPVQQAPSQGYISPVGVPAAGTDEATNPDYNGNTAATTTPGSDQYYNGSTANSYDPNASLFNQPYTGPGMGGYTPNSPYTSLGYGGASPYAYGGGYGGGGYGFGGYGGLSPYSALYSPFYSPFGFGYGSGLSIGFGFGRPFGYGGYGGYGYDPFYSPFGYGGYGLGYGGGYGLGGYGYGLGGYGYGGGNYGYGNGYRRNVIYTGNAGGRSDNNGGNTVLVGPRETRGGAAYSRNGLPAGAPAPVGAAATGNGRGGRYGTNSAAPIGADPAMTVGRVNPGGMIRPSGGQPAGNIDFGATRGRSQNQNMSQPAVIGSNQGQQLQNAPPQAQGQRRGFFRDMFASPSTGQPQMQRQMNPGGQMSSGNYGQPRQQRTYDQSQQRSYSQPQQPQRSFSQPSFNGGGSRGGGGGFGGGGGGGARSGGRGR